MPYSPFFAPAWLPPQGNPLTTCIIINKEAKRRPHCFLFLIDTLYPIDANQSLQIRKTWLMPSSLG